MDGTMDRLWQVAELYWEHDGVKANGQPIWTRAVREIDADGWAPSIPIAAGAGAIATLVGQACPNCGGDLTVTSRSSFAHALTGVADQCRDCTPAFEDKVALVLAPANRQRLEKLVDREREYEAKLTQLTELRERKAALEVSRRAVLHEEYGSVEQDISTMDVHARVAALTLAHHFADGSSVGPVDEYDEELAPTRELAMNLVSAVHSKALATHPSTPLEAYVWEAESGDAATTLAGSYYPLKVRLFLGDDATADDWDSFVSGVRSSLRSDRLTHDEMSQLIALATEVLAQEGIRYFEFMLEGYDLPVVSEQHRDRLYTMLVTAAGKMCLGHIYRAAWTSTSAATNLKAERSRMAKQDVTTFAVNRLEKTLAEYQQPGFDRLQPYREDTRLGLSAVTKTIFYRLLDVDPMTATTAAIRADLVEANSVRRSECLRTIADGEIASNRLRGSRGDWSGREFRAALAAIKTEDHDICSAGCAHDRLGTLAGKAGRSYEKLSGDIGEDEAALALIETIPFMNGQGDERAGDLLLHSLADRIIPDVHASALTT
jgi:hypothetical protein